MTQNINFAAFFILILMVILPIACSVALLGWGILRAKRGLAFGRIMIGVGAVLLLTVLTPITYHLYFGGPWHSRIVTQGISTSGQEYCVLQRFQSWGEPYRISLYVRDQDGVWRWNYLEHQGYAWRSAEVEIRGNQASVLRNGSLFRDINLPTDTIENPTVIPTGYGKEYLPSKFSVEDVYALYR